MAPMAFAQTESPSQTPPSATAAEPSRDAVFMFPPSYGQHAPAGAEAVSFILTELIVEGAYGDVGIAGAPSGQVTVADVYTYAARLQQAYLDAGYPLARVIVPAQELEERGAVRLRVIDGFIETLDLNAVPARARARVQQVLLPLVGKRRPTSAEIERRLLIAGDTAGLALSTTLTAGDTLGGAALVLHGDHDPIAGVIAADNRVSKPYGGFQVAASVALNSPWGGGEQVIVTLAGFPDQHVFDTESRRRYFALGYTTPIGADGMTAQLALDYSSTRPAGEVESLRLQSAYQRIGVGAAYPLVRTRARNLTASVSFDSVRETQHTSITGSSVPLSEDRLSVLRIALNASGSLFGEAQGALQAELSQGLDIFGARSADEATPIKPLSRQGADAEFTRLTLDGGAEFPVASGVSFFVGASAQHAFNEPLLRSEQFSPIGSNGLSGPPPSALVGDWGGAARAELRWRLRNDVMFVTPYLFGAASETHLERPTALESARTGARAFGAGLRVQSPPDRFGRADISLGLELSTLDTDDAGLSDAWGSIYFAVRF
jgi:hemolysin activation/secretion protein